MGLTFCTGGVLMRFAPEDAECLFLPTATDGRLRQQLINRGWAQPSMGWGKVWGSLLIGVISWSLSAAAQATPVAASSPTNPTPILLDSPFQLAQQFQPPNTGSLPGRREGGGTRGSSWFADGQPPLALMPESNLGLTAANDPLFYFYLPPEVAGLEAELYMFNEAGDGEGSRIITLPQTAGIIGVPIPDTIAELSVGDTYRWYFAIRVDPIDRSGDLILSGFVQRVANDPLLQQQLSALPIEDHAAIYGERGLWFDAINLLAMMRSQQPNSPVWETQWETLLRSVDLQRIASQPMLEPSQASPGSPTTTTNTTSSATPLPPATNF